MVIELKSKFGFDGGLTSSTNVLQKASAWSLATWNLDLVVIWARETLLTVLFLLGAGEFELEENAVVLSPGLEIAELFAEEAFS